MFITPENIRTALAFALILFGMVFLIAGLWKLLAREFMPSARALAVHSARISQKGLTDDISRVVDSAARLSESVNALIRTSAGVGVFLIIVGIAFMAGAYFIVR